MMRKPQDHKAVTLLDVAAAADVSAITVSRALRKPEKVSEDVRRRVAAAVEKLGYVPNLAAQALASSRTNVLGVLIPSVTNNVFSDVLHGIYQEVQGTRFQVQLGNTRYSALEEEKLLRIFLSQRPAGLIVSGIDQSDVSRSLLAEANCPVVQIMEIGPEPVDMMIGFSHREAARAACEHLVARGYRRIAFVGARMDPRTQRRLDGYVDALEAAGLFDETLVATTPQPSSFTLGGALFADLLSRRPDVDAVFCNNDDLAVGVLFEAQRRRITVPGRLGICGFNDFEITRSTFPSLTTVVTHRETIGRNAVTMIAGTLAGTNPLPRVLDVGYEVAARASTGEVSGRR
ncbi:LacI family DNA-binding transcriptional regulator [Jiella sp. M17.18]|uniref:LacI family DNA-binding transcriptional regulator n=1 Tax=Jiella sp. M17.18 TaxID=3234247 RepID=UPI0034DE1666